MATSPPTVTRTYRAAIRLGEDFITLEETITLPLGASDDDVQQSVDLGWRIYAAQRAAVAEQVAQVRADTPPAEPTAKPASDKQRTFIDTLAREVGWDHDARAAFAAAHGVASWDAMSSPQAAALIDAIKAYKAAQEQERAETDQRQAEGRTARRPDPERQARVRQTLADAAQRTGVGRNPRPELPPHGDRIRDPEAAPTEAQITRISRTIARLGDAELQQIAPRIAAVLGYQRVAVKGLRDPSTWPYLRDEAEPAHRLTKGRASQIIALLEEVAAPAAA